MKFENKVKRFAKKNFGITAEIGETFYCTPYDKDKNIYFPIEFSKLFRHQTKTFMENYRTHYEENPVIDFYVIALLHEIGHIETTKSQPIALTRIHAMRIATTTDDKEYFNIPQEQLATDFAYAWIKEHRPIVRRFWNSIKNDLEAMGYFDIEGEP